VSQPTVYLDASALVKLVLNEPGHDDLRSYLAGQPSRATSVISEVEVPRAVARASGVDPSEVSLLLHGATVLHLDSTLTRAAARLRPLTLRSLDAIHLASAIDLGEDLTDFVTYDRRLADAARSLGLRVVSPGLDSAV
jgi:predicted nucleic acid-binding protein